MSADPTPPEPQPTRPEPQPTRLQPQPTPPEPVEGHRARSVEGHLAEGYRECARLTWRYGTTYFWGAALLPKARRRHVHAVYALCRLADDIVDDQAGIDVADLDATGARLQKFADHFRQSLATGTSPDPVIAAVVDTVRTCQIDP